MREILLSLFFYFFFFSHKNSIFTNFFLYIFECSYLTADMFAFYLQSYFQTTVCHNYVMCTISVMPIKDEYLSHYLLNIIQKCSKCVITIKVHVCTLMFCALVYVFSRCAKNKKLLSFFILKYTYL